MTAMTPTQELAEHRLGGDLPAYLVRAYREHQSWRAVAVELSRLTGMPISHEAVRTWHRDLVAKDAA